MPTYFEQREKIIQAYFRDEIKPWDQHFCICGTLCDNTNSWFRSIRVSHNGSHGYKGSDFVLLEKALLETMYSKRIYGASPQDDRYESAIFDSMCAALEVLKEIHRSRGENVDEEPAIPFTKRQLQAAR